MIETGTNVYVFPSWGDIPDQSAIFYVVEEEVSSFGSIDYSTRRYSVGGAQHVSLLARAEWFMTSCYFISL